MSFEQFYMTLYEEARRYAIRCIGNEADAEDVLSNAFLYCYTHYSEYDAQKASARTWLYLVLKSRIRNYFRDHRTDESLDASEVEFSEARDYLSEAVELQEKRELLADALSCLPEKQRQLVILRYFYDCDTKELAARTGMSPGNARTTLSRALDALGKILDKKGFERET